MAEPAGDRLFPGRLVAWMHPGEGGRARSAVEVLVGASHGDVGVRVEQRHGYRTRGVAEVPVRHGAGVVRGPGDRRHVVHGTGPEVDVRQSQHRNVVVESRGRVGGVAPAQLEVEQSHDACCDVPIGGEGRGLDHHDLPLRSQPARGHQRLEQGDARRVTDVHVASVDADQRRDPLRDAAAEVDPVRGVPRRDQARAPLLGDHLVQPGGHVPREGTQRVPVEVHQAVRDLEELASAAQRARLVEGDGSVAVARRAGHGVTLRVSGARAAGPRPGPAASGSRTRSCRRVDRARRSAGRPCGRPARSPA